MNSPHANSLHSVCVCVCVWREWHSLALYSRSPLPHTFSGSAPVDRSYYMGQAIIAIGLTGIPDNSYCHLPPPQNSLAHPGGILLRQFGEEQDGFPTAHFNCSKTVGFCDPEQPVEVRLLWGMEGGEEPSPNSHGQEWCSHSSESRTPDPWKNVFPRVWCARLHSS